MGEQTKADVVSMRLADGDKLTIEGLALDVIYTPGHTDNSYSFIMPDRVFTGDTLLIRGTGRTDFQNGDPRQQYDSIFSRLLKLPDETLVYPGARLQGRHGLDHRRGEGVQSAPAGEVGRRICRADEQPQARQSEDDGRRGAGQHARRAAPGGDRAPRLGDHGAEAIALDRPAGRGADRSARAHRAREARHHPGLAARALPDPAGEHPRRRHAARACASRPASASCSTARSASARRWRCRPRRTPASPRPATSRAASTRGRRRRARWRRDSSADFPRCIPRRAARSAPQDEVRSVEAGTSGYRFRPA